uniref:Uncharacterized protein n=1 Tax=Arundo donax TaxID=35708 RepID=A0A0A9CHK1_ARUDO
MECLVLHYTVYSMDLLLRKNISANSRGPQDIENSSMSTFLNRVRARNVCDSVFSLVSYIHAPPVLSWYLVL